MHATRHDKNEHICAGGTVHPNRYLFGRQSLHPVAVAIARAELIRLGVVNTAGKGARSPLRGSR